MKTKLLIIATLVLAAMTFTSCTKDNSLENDLAFQQSEMQKSEGTPDPGGIGTDILSNAPDPFRNTTTISFIIKGNSNLVEKKWVDLVIYKKSSFEMVAVLLDNELKLPGSYSVKFDATGLAPGKYIARLTVKTPDVSAVVNEEMTKSSPWGGEDEFHQTN